MEESRECGFELKEGSMGFQFASKSKQPAQHKSSPPPMTTVRSLAPTHPVLQLQRTIGNQGVLRLLESQRIQPKCACGGGCPRCQQANLKISQPGDRYEQEADRLADQVMRMSDSQVQRQKEGEGSTRAESTTPNRPALTVSGRTGHSLPDSVRSFFEPRFGHDFSQVRVHTDDRAAESARSINALAYTVGNHVVFGDGQYAPQTRTGQHLLAHELAHVTQQRKTPQPNVLRRKSACPETVVIGSLKARSPFSQALFDKGFRTWLGLDSYMKVGPKDAYNSCIYEKLSVVKNTCGTQGNLSKYKPCGPKKHCLTVGDRTKSKNLFWDMHRSTFKAGSLLEGSGKKTCQVTCLQKYICPKGGKEVGSFYVTRTFKAEAWGKDKVHVTLGSIEKVSAPVVTK